MGCSFQRPSTLAHVSSSFSPLDGAIADVVVRLGQLMLSDPSISEVDINPLMVGAEGAVALDALIVPGTLS